MNLYSYIVTYDGGFAPNPFFGYCTLAVCKPVIRRTSEIGDWIFGLSPKEQGHKLIYAMKITEKLSFDNYYNDSRFKSKIPKHNNPEDYVGDNFYKPLCNGIYEKIPSLHSIKDRENDLKGKCVLVSEHFYYFGAKPETLPDDLLSDISAARYFRKLAYDKNKETIDALLIFIGQKHKGINSYPTKWPPKTLIFN